MKSLREYITESLKQSHLMVDPRWVGQNAIDYMGTCEALENKFISDIIYENLQTHDATKLQDKIYDLCSDDIEYIEDIGTEEQKKSSKRSFNIYFKNWKLSQKYYNDQDFENLLNFFNYKLAKKRDTKIEIEPVYPEKCNNLLKDSNLICYHFCRKDLLEDILEKGLRCKCPGYRLYPYRIYVFISNNLRKDKVEFNNFVNEYGEGKDMNNYELIKIDLNKIGHLTFDFYQDTQMKSKLTAFTYHNIPKQCLSKVNFDWEKYYDNIR